MKKCITTSLCLFLFFTTFSFAKVSSPIKGLFMPERVTAAVGKTVQLTLTLETSTLFSAVEVSIDLPRGIELVKGKRVFELLNFKPGEKKSFSYDVRVLQKGEKRIIVTAKAKNLGPNEAFGNAFSLVINPESVKDNSVVTTDSDGTRAVVKTVPNNR